MTLENDDKTYNVLETLITCEEENIPMILDYHHYMANIGEVRPSSLLDSEFLTHGILSYRTESPYFFTKIRSSLSFSCDFVSLDFVLPFLKMAKELDQDFDIMIEAKQKNLAMQKLVEDVASIRGVKRLTSSSVQW